MAHSEEMPSPELELAFEAVAEVAAPLDLGVTPMGHRRIIQITGGSFEGPGLKGRILPGGADWQILRTDGTAELDARYTLQTDQGGLIYVVNRGLRHGPPEVLRRIAAGETVDPRSYYFRSAAFFETSAPELQWLTKTIVIGAGERQRDKVLIRFWKVL
jgi:hypothetical protein